MLPLCWASTPLCCHPRDLQINGSVVGSFWQCLGMYAMPGRPVKITVPASLVTAGGATLHIGGWTDTLYG